MTKVILWWNSSCDESYLVMKVKIVKEVKRSDSLWRFACGDVFSSSEALLSVRFMFASYHIWLVAKQAAWKHNNFKALCTEPDVWLFSTLNLQLFLVGTSFCIIYGSCSRWYPFHNIIFKVEICFIIWCNKMCKNDRLGDDGTLRSV